ncbi:ABC transporter ATP-binding protein [Candidatus Poribacteria bacterium]|jgi:putative ABC transport system ATP-binding protein|nr:ABC transporter ATP-binding protein [Candidatus Poribacteria bacterium]MBT5713910.1 ABC transporter ATP-binding protein [Candidatus Poribacteria bacterium]MBT7808726.1 ABC transporter ATP-binding protein [Candidatus Poribacteria bacterium]
MAEDVVVTAAGVTKEYRMGAEVVHALAGVDLAINRGEYLSLMGPSGSGKSTLFNMIGALDQPTAGSVTIEGEDMAKLTMEQLAWIRCNRMGYIFQSFNLLVVMSALDNVTLPMIFAGVSPKERTERGKELLATVGLGDRYHHLPTELSGGQQQRVAIARALANGPDIILADEPTANLDTQTGREIIDLLKEMNESQGVTVVSATHDLKMLDVSDRVVYIRDGGVEQIRNRDEIDIHVGSLDDH